MLQDLLTGIADVDVVSFDVFDTLFVRPLCDPEDAFDLIGAKYGIAGFRSLRRTAQSEAFRSMRETGRAEITLDGIYDHVRGTTVPAERLRQFEYDLELALTVPNPELIGVFREAIES